MKHAFNHKNSWRATVEDVQAYAQQEIGGTLVHGFSEIVDEGDSTVGGARIAGYLASNDHREWYLSLGAKRPLIWKTMETPKETGEFVLFTLAMGFGNGSPLPQPSGSWDIYLNEKHAVSVRVVKHSQLWRGEHCSLGFAAKRIEAAEPFGSLCLGSALQQESFAAFGPAILKVPAEWVRGDDKATIRIESNCDVASTRWLQLVSAPNMIGYSDIYSAIDVLMATHRRSIGGLNVYFGDIHTHSGQGDDASSPLAPCGCQSRDDNYEYAKGPGGARFLCIDRS